MTTGTDIKRRTLPSLLLSISVLTIGVLTIGVRYVADRTGVAYVAGWMFVVGALLILIGLALGYRRAR